MSTAPSDWTGRCMTMRESFVASHRCKDVDRRAGCWPGWPLTDAHDAHCCVCVLYVLLIVRGPWWIPTWNLCGNVQNDARHHANAAPVWRGCSEWHKAWALDPKTRYPWNMTHALTEDEHRPRPAREASFLEQVPTADSAGELPPKQKRHTEKSHGR